VEVPGREAQAALRGRLDGCIRCEVHELRLGHMIGEHAAHSNRLHALILNLRTARYARAPLHQFDSLIIGNVHNYSLDPMK
jgi:hypothetical protein